VQTVGSISISPAGPLTLPLPEGQTSVQQTFTGTVLDTEATPKPIADLTIYAFVNNVQIGTAVTAADGTYSFIATFTPSVLPASYTFNMSSNASNT
jgi:hypothetical protein